MFGAWLAPAVFAVALDAQGQASPGGVAPDEVRAEQTSSETPDPELESPFYQARLEWVNSVSPETLGIGSSYQSANPTFETGLSFWPRWRFSGTEADGFYVAGQLDLVHEVTNGDSTTRRGETTFSDALLLSAYERTLTKHGDYETTLFLRAPLLTLPTSKASANNGTVMGLGVGPRILQALPLLGGGSPVFPRMAFRGTVEYMHTFTSAEVPTNPELQRVRLSADGRTVPGDQLTGAAFPEHELTFGLRTLFEVAEGLQWVTDLSYRPIWKYGFADADVCITTGCEPLRGGRDATRYTVITGLETELEYRVIDELSVSAGYSNVQVQPGPDGQRRNVFYAPGALFAFKLVVHLDTLYDDATRRSASVGGSDVASR